MNSNKVAYIFLDEGGNFDFSIRGTKFFTMTCINVFRPFPINSELTNLRFDLLEEGENIEYFHASEDRQKTRNKVFNTIVLTLNKFEIDSIIVEKCKTHPSIQIVERFYPKILGYLLRYVVNRIIKHDISQVVVITDTIPVKKKRDTIEKIVKITLGNMLSPGVSYNIFHHDSKSCCGLQIADYCNWAIYRYCENNVLI